MKALILAAGRGTRLGDLTAQRPKPMLPIQGVPMLERILSGIARQTDIRQFVLVTGYHADVIRDYFAEGARWGWQVEYVQQDPPRGLADAVNLAAPLLADEPFLMTYGDIMLDPVNYRRFVETYRNERMTLVGLNWVDDPTRGAAVYLHPDGRVARIEEKPAPGTAATHWNNAGLFVLPPEIFRFTAGLALSPRGEYELSDALTALIAAGHPVRGLELTGHWRDVGTPEDYAAINAAQNSESSGYNKRHE